MQSFSKYNEKVTCIQLRIKDIRQQRQDIDLDNMYLNGKNNTIFANKPVTTDNNTKFWTMFKNVWKMKTEGSGCHIIKLLVFKYT